MLDPPARHQKNIGFARHHCTLFSNNIELSTSWMMNSAYCLWFWPTNSTNLYSTLLVLPITRNARPSNSTNGRSCSLPVPLTKLVTDQATNRSKLIRFPTIRFRSNDLLLRDISNRINLTLNDLVGDEPVPVVSCICQSWQNKNPKQLFHGKTPC